MVGVQWRADHVRDGLAAAGRPQGGRRPTAYLLADDLGTVLAHAWTARAFDQGGPGWTDFVRNSSRYGHLPPRADLPRMARSAAHKYGAGKVVVVLDPDALAAELGTAPLQEPPRLGANAVDLVRRVGEPLGLLVDPADRPRLLRESLGARLDGSGGCAARRFPRGGPGGSAAWPNAPATTSRPLATLSSATSTGCCPARSRRGPWPRSTARCCRWPWGCSSTR